MIRNSSRGFPSTSKLNVLVCTGRICHCGLAAQRHQTCCGRLAGQVFDEIEVCRPPPMRASRHIVRTWPPWRPWFECVCENPLYCKDDGASSHSAATSKPHRLCTISSPYYAQSVLSPRPNGRSSQATHMVSPSCKPTVLRTAWAIKPMCLIR